MHDQKNTPSPDDRTEFSESAAFSSGLSHLPAHRARKVAAIRRSIAEKTYETPEKLDIAINRFLERNGHKSTDVAA